MQKSRQERDCKPEDEKAYQQILYLADPYVSIRHFSVFAAIVQVYPHMFRIRGRSHHEIRPAKGWLADPEKDRLLSSLGRQRIRSCSLKTKCPDACFIRK